MADIDKTLPNIILNKPKSDTTEVDITEDITEKGPVEVTEDEDGATIDLIQKQCLYQKKAITLQT